jgi:uncharacterized iron-regulated membrane protein
LTVSLISGVVTYKKWWRGFFRWPRGGGGRRLAGDLHRLVGLWSLWFVALIALTGVWYLVETLGGRAAVPRLPVVAGSEPVAGEALDRMVARAQAARPSLEINEIRFGKEGVVILGQDGAWLVRDRTNAVAFDPADGRMTRMLDGRDLSLHQRISEMADPLHFGTFGGLATKLIWFVFGAALTTLAVTGTVIYSLRLARTIPGSTSASGRAWRGMGAWAYAGAGLVLLALALTPGAIAGAS